MIQLYGFYPSGNSYKVELVLTRLEIPYRFIHVDLLAGESRTPEFLAKNPNGRIPVVELDGRYLAESHAIISYFAEGTELVPTDRFARAKMLEWMCFEQYHVEPNIGTARYHLSISNKSPESIGLLLQSRQKGSKHALGILEQHLADRRFMVGDSLSLADISLFAYTHVAEEAGISLIPYPHMRAWHDRVRAEPRFITMTTLDDLAARDQGTA